MHVKYPRTLHIPQSPGCTSDDKIMRDISGIIGYEVVITEKMDGENTTMYRDHIHARSLDSKDHPSRHYVKGLWGKIRADIPIGFRICGENCYAKHSLAYHNLSDYFLVFSIWNGDVCLSWKDTKDYCELLGLSTVPVLYTGILTADILEETIYNIDTTFQEGFVIRPLGEFLFSEFASKVGKWVRYNHVQSDQHIISGWRATNDISSPTHSSDILEELKKLDLSGEQMETLYRHVLDIWFDVLVND